MNETKFNSTYSGLMPSFQKVVDAVPIAEHWDGQQIFNELQRTRSGVCRNYASLKGVLNKLVETGLVVESPRGMFKRVKVTASKPDVQQPARKEEQQMQQTQTKTASTLSTIDRLSVLAKQLTIIANDLETAALEIEEQNAANAEGRKKLEQLQALLKGVA